MLDQIDNKDIKEMAKELSGVEKPVEKYTGRGTQARINTAAEKHLFNTWSNQ